MKKEIIKTQEMNNQEILECVKLLKQAIKERKITFEHANPIEQNCYTSSSDIIGVYFPNSVITLESEKVQNKFYRFCALAKVNNKLGIVKVLKDDVKEEIKIAFAPYKFIDFDTFLYGKEYLCIKEGIERDLVIYMNKLEKLNKVKRVYKKDHKPFKDILKNFSGVYMRLYFDIYGEYCHAIEIDDIRIYRVQPYENKTLPTVEEIESLINEEKELVKGYIKECKKDLEKLPKDFREFERIAATLKNFKERVNHWTYFSRALDYLIVK